MLRLRREGRRRLIRGKHARASHPNRCPRHVVLGMRRQLATDFAEILVDRPLRQSNVALSKKIGAQLRCSLIGYILKCGRYGALPNCISGQGARGATEVVAWRQRVRARVCGEDGHCSCLREPKGRRGEVSSRQSSGCDGCTSKMEGKARRSRSAATDVGTVGTEAKA